MILGRVLAAAATVLVGVLLGAVYWNYAPVGVTWALWAALMAILTAGWVNSYVECRALGIEVTVLDAEEARLRDLLEESSSSREPAGQ